MTLCSTLHPTMTLCSQGPECDCDGFVEFDDVNGKILTTLQIRTRLVLGGHSALQSHCVFPRVCIKARIMHV